MKIQFLGAAQTVTGSCFMMEAHGVRFAVDCGLHQGNAEIFMRNENSAVYRPKDVDFFVLTHAHMDHAGLLPRMVKDGFRGVIYATPPTRELLEIMLLDSAHIQEMEAAWRNRKRRRRNEGTIEPLYREEDARNAVSLFEGRDYGQPFEPAPGIRVVFHDAGHILGSAFLEIQVMDGDRPLKLLFSGDLGRPDALLVNDPSPGLPADYLFLESTYGNRDHKSESASLDELAEAIKYSYSRGEKVIIPAFAVERSQEVLFSLNKLLRQGKLPADIPVFLDSPLAIRATEIFKRNMEYLDEETRTLMDNGVHPLDLPGLRFTLNTEESMEINRLEGPAVVISASGMADAGRIKHHLKHNLWRKGASVVFVGYQAVGTAGRKIVDGAREVTLFGEQVAVKARIFTIGGFSAHAGQSQIIQWLEAFARPGMRIFLIHGEEQAMSTLAGIIEKRLGLSAAMPTYLEEFELVPGRLKVTEQHSEQAFPPVDLEGLLARIEAGLGRLKGRMPDLRQRPWAEQTEIRDRLGEIVSEIENISDE